MVGMERVHSAQYVLRGKRWGRSMLYVCVAFVAVESEQRRKNGDKMGNQKRDTNVAITAMGWTRHVIHWMQIQICKLHIAQFWMASGRCPLPLKIDPDFFYTGHIICLRSVGYYCRTSDPPKEHTLTSRHFFCRAPVAWRGRFPWIEWPHQASARPDAQDFGVVKTNDLSIYAAVSTLDFIVRKAYS